MGLAIFSGRRDWAILPGQNDTGRSVWQRSRA